MDGRYYDGARLREWREARGMTAIEAARQAGITRMQLNRAERGLSASFDLLVRLAALYGKSHISLLHPDPETSRVECVKTA